MWLLEVETIQLFYLVKISLAGPKLAFSRHKPADFQNFEVVQYYINGTVLILETDLMFGFRALV